MKKNNLGNDFANDLLNNFLTNELPAMNAGIVKNYEAEQEIKKAARKLAQEVGNKINVVSFSEEVRQQVSYPRQMLLECLIEELQKIV